MFTYFRNFSFLILLSLSSVAYAVPTSGIDGMAILIDAQPITPSTIITTGDVTVGGNLSVNGPGPHTFFANLTGTGPKDAFVFTSNVDMASGNDTSFVFDRATDVASPGTSSLVAVRNLGVDELLISPLAHFDWGNNIVMKPAAVGPAPALFFGHGSGPTVGIFSSPRFEIGMDSGAELGWTASATGAALEIILTRESAGVMNINGGLTLDDNLSVRGGTTLTGYATAFANVSTGNSPITVTTSDYSFDCDATAGNVTFNLMSSATAPGQGYEITTTGAGKCMLHAAGGDNINGFSTYSGLDTSGESVLIRANGINRWTIKASH